VLEALGVAMDLGPEQVATCIREAGIGFMFAPAFHPAMKHVMPVRRELGVRTVFNLLGPLTNPAGAQAQLLGVADPLAQEKMARVLAALGTRHALVVRGADGVDELTLSGATAIYEVREGAVQSYTLTPEELGLPSAPVSALRGGTAEENAAVVRAVLSGERGPRRDVVLLNAAAALVAADAAPTLREGLALAAAAIDTGRAAAALERLVAVSQRLRGAAA
jgi:anthranilate phosphoribosyltransferase